MEKGRSNYNIPITGDLQKVNQLIQSYLSADGFRQVNENGESYYQKGDGVVTELRRFHYGFSGNTLLVCAWIKGPFGDIKIEQNGLGGMNIGVNDYRSSLNSLFQEIQKLNVQGNVQIFTNNMGVGQTNIGQPMYENTPMNNQFAQNFQNELTKKQEKLCKIGFWLSILGLVCSFVGVAYGILIYIMDFYFAAQGLKTSKRKMAIATIILSIISIAITILWIVGGNIE